MNTWHSPALAYYYIKPCSPIHRLLWHCLQGCKWVWLEEASGNSKHSCRTILMADKRTNTADMHGNLNLLTLAKRRTLHFNTECFKNATDTNVILNKFFNLECNRLERQTRNTVALCMHIPDIRSVLGRKAFSYHGPSSWNGLDKLLRQAQSVQIFKSNLTKELCRDVNHPG